MKLTQRRIYNTLDFLGDVGGLFDGLKTIAYALIGLLTNTSLPLFLTGKLFYANPAKDSTAHSVSQLSFERRDGVTS